MKRILFFTFIFFYTFILSQIKVSVSPAIDVKDELNHTIVLTIEKFFQSKDSKYWLKSDFEQFDFPYYEILNIESGKLGSTFYQPSIMEIIPTENNFQKMVKIAFVGHDKKNNSNWVKAIYTVMANKKGENIFLSSYTDYATRNWKKIKIDSLQYILSPYRNLNLKEVELQKKNSLYLSDFFEIPAFPITYYSCVTPKEVFQIKGFDYHPMMYSDQSGGFAQAKNNIFSGNNSDFYPHEIVHLYTQKKFKSISPFFDEGIATYLGGSGKFDYLWHKEKLKRFLRKNPDFKLLNHLDPYERLYFENETPIPYIIAAWICERIIKIYGKQKLFEVFESKDSVPEILIKLGITQENLKEEFMN